MENGVGFGEEIEKATWLVMFNMQAWFRWKDNLMCQWQHLECAGLNGMPKSTHWYCKLCRDAAKEGNS